MKSVTSVQLQRGLLQRAMRVSGKRSARAVLTYALKVVAGKSTAYEPDDGPLSDKQIAAIRLAYPQSLSKKAKTLFGPV